MEIKNSGKTIFQTAENDLLSLMTFIMLKGEDIANDRYFPFKGQLLHLPKGKNIRKIVVFDDFKFFIFL